MSASIGNESFGHTTTAVTNDTLSVVAAAGAACIVTVSMSTKTRTLSSVSDSAGNTGWLVIDGAGGSGQGSAWIAWNPNLGAAITTITLHYSGTSKITWSAMEVTGLAGTVQAHIAESWAAALSSGSSLTTTGDVFLVGAAGAPSATISSVDAPFTLQSSDSGSGIGEGQAADEETANGTYTCTFNYSSSVASSTLLVAFDVTASTVTVNGTASSVVSAPGAAVGTVTNHKISGTASSSVPATATAVGTVTNHKVSGTASGATPALAAAAGTVKNHLYSGAATSSVPATATAVGTVSNHAIHGIARGPTGTAGAATGTISTHKVSGTASAPVAAVGAAVGTPSNHAIHGVASSPVAAVGAATGTVSTHKVSGSASSDVTTIGHAAGTIVGGTVSRYRRRPRPSVQ